MFSRPRFVVLAIIALSLPFPLSLYAGPPPAGVQDILTEMRTFETSYRGGKWDEAVGSAEAMERKINEIFVQAQLDDFVLEEALADVKKHAAAENVPELEDAYIAYQKQYFNFVSHFDHTVHPILIKIEQHVMTGAPEAYAGKDLEDAVWEMKTAAMLADHGREVFIGRGVSEVEVNEFKSKVLALDQIGKSSESGKIGEMLDHLQIQYRSFMERYRK